MLIHSNTTFDMVVAAHRARVASATRHRHVDTPGGSPPSSISADRHQPLSQPQFQASRLARRSFRRIAQ